MRSDSSLDLTIVLTNFFSGKELVQCLHSLAGLRQGLRSEILVVDNSPPNASESLATCGISDVRLVPNDRNIGYAAACNRALRESRAPYVLYLNPDTRYLSGSGRELLEWLERDSSVALVGPRVMNADGTRQFSCRSFPSWSTAVCHRYSLLTRLLPTNPLSKKYLLPELDGKLTEVDWASACCLLVRRESVEQVGGFDEKYFLFYEDVDLARRLKLCGGRCVYYPKLAFSHTMGASRALLPDCGAKFRHLSAAHYFTKNIENPLWAKLLSAAINTRGKISSFCQCHWPYLY